MNVLQQIKAFGEDGRHQDEIARIMGPVAIIAELKGQGIIQIRPLLKPTDQDPQWLFDLADFIEHLNTDIQSNVATFTSLDMQRVTAMRNFSIAEQVKIVGRMIRSKLKGIVDILPIMPPELLG